MAHHQRWGRLKPIHRTCFIFYPLAHTAPPTQADPHVQSLIGTTSQHQDCTHLHNYAQPLSSLVPFYLVPHVFCRPQYTQESTRQPEDHIH
jgi:hypothetical protein